MLQKEIEIETGIKFGVLDTGLFIDLQYINKTGAEQNTESN